MPLWGWIATIFGILLALAAIGLAVGAAMQSREEEKITLVSGSPTPRPR